MLEGLRENGVCLLCFKLIWQDQICIAEKCLVGGHNVLVDVEPSLVTHDGIEDYLALAV